MSNATSERKVLPVAQCGCGADNRSKLRSLRWTTAGGLLAALGLCAACCLLPFALFSVGVAGAWVSSLEAAARYKEVLLVLTVGLLAYGFRMAYRRPVEGEAVCEVCISRKRSVRWGLWIAMTVTVAALVYERIEPFLAPS